jgi:hypothetical protein
MKTEQDHYSAQRNVEQEVLFPKSDDSTPLPVTPSELTDEQEIIRSNNSVEAPSPKKTDVETLFRDMFKDYAHALQSQEYTRPQPVFKLQVDETGYEYKNVQVGESQPAVYDMYDSLILYARGSILGGQIPIRPELFNEQVRTIDEYIEAYVLDGIQHAVATYAPEVAQPGHITVQETGHDEEAYTFRDIVKKVTGRTLEIVGIAPLYHSAPTAIIQKAE